jgi:hypothetical protein
VACGELVVGVQRLLRRQGRGNRLCFQLELIVNAVEAPRRAGGDTVSRRAGQATSRPGGSSTVREHAGLMAACLTILCDPGWPYGLKLWPRIRIKSGAIVSIVGS